MHIQFKPIEEVCASQIVDLMGQPLLRRHMPLLPARFSFADGEAFIAAKAAVWRDCGFGPSAIVLNGEFAGWGGVQPAGEDVEIALVLHPRHWGAGRAIYTEMLRNAFEVNQFESVVVLLPLSRRRERVLSALGFRAEGEVVCEGVPFRRYRLWNPGARAV